MNARHIALNTVRQHVPGTAWYFSCEVRQKAGGAKSVVPVWLLFAELSMWLQRANESHRFVHLFRCFSFNCFLLLALLVLMFGTHFQFVMCKWFYRYPSAGRPRKFRKLADTLRAHCLAYLLHLSRSLILSLNEFHLASTIWHFPALSDQKASAFCVSALLTWPLAHRSGVFLYRSLQIIINCQ